MESKKTKKQMNIMTSCDDLYFEYVYNQIINISKTQKSFINFFFVYNRIPNRKIIKLISFCDNIENLSLFPVKVTKNIEQYNELAKYGGVTANTSMLFPFEVYFQLNAYEFLPDWVERVLVIHAADIMFLSDISEFYYSEFNNKLLTVELTNYLISDERTKINSDLYSVSDREYFIKKHKGNATYFNSGVILLNVDLQRNNNRGISYYIEILNQIKQIKNTKEMPLYTGDQCYYAIAYLGEVNVFKGISETKKNHRRYNYSHFSYKKDKAYGFQSNTSVRIFHFDGLYKPWLFSKKILIEICSNDINSEFNDSFIPIRFSKYFLDFWEYDRQSPYHEIHNYQATLNEKIWRDFYLPLLKRIKK